jgi:hypothetical protein
MIADVPPAIVQIAQRAGAQEKGVVTYRLHRVFDVHAGPQHRHDDLVLAIARQDGRIVKVRVVKAIVGGNAADASKTAEIENQYEHPNPGDLFHAPFDPRYVNEYGFQAVDPQTYRFTSTMHDSSHGNGTLSLDASGNVVKYVYSPNVLPQYTTSGTVTNDRAQVLPNFWFLTREAHEYRGHYLIFGGGATAVITYDQFKRYEDVNAAVSALSTYTSP